MTCLLSLGATSQFPLREYDSADNAHGCERSTAIRRRDADQGERKLLAVASCTVDCCFWSGLYPLAVECQIRNLI